MIEETLVRCSTDVLCCFFVQDLVPSALCWLNKCPDITAKMLTGTKSINTNKGQNIYSGMLFYVFSAYTKPVSCLFERI